MEQLVARWAHNPKVAGSSPVPATKKSKNIFVYKKINLLLQGNKIRSVGLGVMTPGFHPGNRGSIPLRTTNTKKFKKMANHKSAIKRIRQNNTKRLRNRYFAVSTRSAVRKLKEITEKAEAEKMFPEVSSMLDKLAKRNIIHNNKAANLKSKLYKHIQAL